MSREQAPQACAIAAATALKVQNSLICVTLDGPATLERRRLLDWVERSARIVAAYYGAFPARQLDLHIDVAREGAVAGGRTTNNAGLNIDIRVGSSATEDDLRNDWVLVHEMVHLALPELGRRHNWLAEGLATYVEGVARAQFGNRQIADVWAEYRHSMPAGLPRRGEGGMDETVSWGRTYWGGALYCLQADVAIRERTHNRLGLQSALRAILQATGGYANQWDIEKVLHIGDDATGTTTLSDLYQATKATPVLSDLALLWRRLGVPERPLSQRFDDAAPLAAVREAITAPSP
jgi:hypothetical protein